MKLFTLFVATLAATHMFGQGCFNPPMSFSTAYNPVRPIAADMNNDGAKDVVFCATLGPVVHLNKGNGVFPLAMTYSANNMSPTRLAIVDLNADGFPDVATVRNGTLMINLNDGAGGLLTHQNSTISGVGDIVSADFNLDGKGDLALSSSQGLKIVLNNGTPGLSVSSTFTGSGGFLTAADFNGDGFSDIAGVVGAQTLITVWYGTGTGAFISAVTFPIPIKGYAIASAEVNADGKADLVVSGYSLTVLLSTGTNSFSALPAFTVTGNCMEQVSAGDINADGNVDLVLPALLNHSVTVIFGDGTGNFPSALSLAASLNSNSAGLTVADFNNNGKPDIASVHQGAQELILLMDCQTTYLPENDINNTMVFPLPATDILQFRSDFPITQLRLYDQQGKISERIIGEDIESLNISGFPQGCYFLQLFTARGVSTRKVIIAR